MCPCWREQSYSGNSYHVGDPNGYRQGKSTLLQFLNKSHWSIVALFSDIEPWGPGVPTKVLYAGVTFPGKKDLPRVRRGPVPRSEPTSAETTKRTTPPGVRLTRWEASRRGDSLTIDSLHPRQECPDEGNAHTADGAPRPRALDWNQSTPPFRRKRQEGWDWRGGTEGWDWRKDPVYTWPTLPCGPPLATPVWTVERLSDFWRLTPPRRSEGPNTSRTVPTPLLQDPGGGGSWCPRPRTWCLQIRECRHLRPPGSSSVLVPTKEGLRVSRLGRVRRRRAPTHHVRRDEEPRTLTTGQRPRPKWPVERRTHRHRCERETHSCGEYHLLPGG